MLQDLQNDIQVMEVNSSEFMTKKKEEEDDYHHDLQAVEEKHAKLAVDKEV